MDLTPPSLTRSPTSPPNTYCPSEASSLGYPSPILLEQQYKLSVYGTESPCSIPHQQLDSETTLPPLEAMTQTGWNSPTIMSSSASPPGPPSTSMPSILAPDYDPFANYDSPLPPSYNQEMFPAPPHHSNQPHSHAHQHVHTTSHPQTHVPGGVVSPAVSRPEQANRSPGPSVAPRSPFSFHQPPTSAPGPGSLGQRLKAETSGSEYSPVAVPNFPSPRSIHHAPYASTQSPYPTTPSTILGDSAAGAWPKSGEYDTAGAPPAEVYYAGASPVSGPPLSASTSGSAQAGAAGTTAYIPDRRIRVARPPRRAPRRLTTKEEANFQCQVKGCGKLFSRSYNYKAHMETHDEKREYPFPCPVKMCARKFVRKTDLQRHHQSVHMKERNHKCDYCGRLFARKDTLRRHMEDGCSKRFDLGTLDIREGYDGMHQPSRNISSATSISLGAPQGLMSGAGILPPMAIPHSPANTGILNPAGLPTLTSPLRSRGDPTSATSVGHPQDWTR